MLDSLIQLDTSLFFTINEGHNTFLDGFMYYFSDKIIWIPMYISILYVMWKSFVWKHLLFCVIAVALLILVADQVAHLLKEIFGRLRPSNLENPISEFVHIVNEKRGGRYGFPSNHASNTWALAFYIFLLFRKHWLSFTLMTWALITCYSRSYLGVHYPGDWVFGTMVGITTACVIYTLQIAICNYPRGEVRQAYAPIIIFTMTVAGIVAYSTFRALVS